jgi:hypothetical protein
MIWMLLVGCVGLVGSIILRPEDEFGFATSLAVHFVAGIYWGVFFGLPLWACVGVISHYS